MGEVGGVGSWDGCWGIGSLAGKETLHSCGEKSLGSFSVKLSPFFWLLFFHQAISCVEGAVRPSALPKPYPSSLVSYYTFDQRSWNGSFYEDVANRSLRPRHVPCTCRFLFNENVDDVLIFGNVVSDC